MRTFGLIVVGFLIGIGVGYIFFFAKVSSNNTDLFTVVENKLDPKQTIGFLPFWLLDKAQKDYSPYLNTLTYFGLSVDGDGHILKFTNPGESEPGWYTFNSGKADPFLNTAKQKGLKLSLLMISGNEDKINSLITDPETNAHNLVSDVKPIMQQHGFTDLNLDIESVKEASDEARMRFGQFVKQVKMDLNQDKLGTLTVEIAPDMLVKKGLINLDQIKDYADYIVLMTYDYHFIGSQVTGPVAPVSGGQVESEYDVMTAVDVAKQTVDAKKLILGIPVYGYRWETIRDASRSATIPSSGVTISNRTIEELLTNCPNCVTKHDQLADEDFTIYPNEDSTAFYQTFYPTAASTQVKLDLTKNKKLGGVAIWALGYEDSKVLDPLKSYK